MGPLLGLLNSEGKTIRETPVSSGQLAQLVKLIEEGVISGKIAKTVFEETAKTGKLPQAIIEEKGLKQVSDTSTIEKLISEVLTESPKQVEEYKAGKKKVLGYFVGQVMKRTKGKANPQIVNELLKKALES